ncbi:MAG: TonB-dependent receptor [Bacteroidota bacterium]
MLFFFIICLYTSMSFGQQKTLMGEIEVEEGFLIQPSVEVLNEEKKVEFIDEHAFEIKDLAKKKYKLKVSSASHQTKIVEVDLSKTTRIKISLELSVQDLDEVIILDEQSGISQKTPYSFTPVNLEAVEYKSQPNGLMGELRNTPGIYGAEFGQGIVKPFIRGLGFSRVVTIYQGNKLENQQWGADHGLGLNDLGVRQVDVIKGPASVLYGSGALGGVLLVKDDESYLKSTSLTGNAGLSYNSVSHGMRGFASVGKKNEQGWFFAADLAYENHADYKDGNQRIIGNSRFNSEAFRLHAGVEKENFQNKLSFTFMNQNLGIIDDNEMDESLATYRNDRSMQLPFQEVSDFLLSYKQETQHQHFDTFLHLSHHLNTRKEIEDSKDEIDLGFRQNHTFYNTRISTKNNAIKHSLGLQGSFLSNNNIKSAQEFLIPDAHFFENGLYYLAEYEINNYFFQGALRYDYRKVTADASSQSLVDYGFVLPGDPDNRKLDTDFGGFTGSIGVSKEIDESQRVKLNISSGFRSPDLAELFSYGPHPGTNRFELGNANFEREQSYQADINYELTNRTFTLALSAFGSLVDNYIFFSSTGETRPDSNLQEWEYQQVKAHLYGGEFSVTYRPFQNQRLQVEVGGAAVRGVNQTFDEPLTFIPPDNFNIRLKTTPFENYSTNFFANFRYVAQQNRPGFNEQQTSAYQTFDIGASYQLDLGADELDFGITVFNLFNESYIDHMSLLRAFEIRSPGRNIMASVRYSF